MTRFEWRPAPECAASILMALEPKAGMIVSSSLNDFNSCETISRTIENSEVHDFVNTLAIESCAIQQCSELSFQNNTFATYLGVHALDLNRFTHGRRISNATAQSAGFESVGDGGWHGLAFGKFAVKSCRTLSRAIVLMAK